MSLPEIGQNFGGRDHTTVLHACRQIASLRESTPQIQHDFAFLLQVLRRLMATKTRVNDVAGKRC